ncbi:MAG TPA: DUF6702 family protein [Rhodothermales bacterium]|nr:DUF6702 family protein [Rhodothermales bacterium]
MRRLLFLGFVLFVGATSAAASPAAPPIVLVKAHNVHVSNGRMAVEGTTALAQVRMFKDDLTQALTNLAGRQIALAATPEVDALATRYINRHLIVNAGGRVLVGRIVGSSEDAEMWAYQVEYQAPTPIRSLILTNRLLFDLFEDQRNLFRVMFFPSERTEAFYFVKGSDEYRMQV